MDVGSELCKQVREEGEKRCPLWTRCLGPEAAPFEKLDCSILDYLTLMGIIYYLLLLLSHYLSLLEKKMFGSRN